MSAVTLITTTGATYTAELQAKRDFRLPATGNAGQASVTVPYSSPLASQVTPDGLDLLLIQHATAGDWLGIVTTVEYGPDGITLGALQPWGMLGRRLVKRSDTVTNIWPAYVVGVAMDAGSVAGLFRDSGMPGGDTPLIPSYSFGYGDAWAVIQAMMDQSDGELSVDAATGRMDWCGALARANAYGPLLIAGQSLRGWKYATNAGDQIAEVVGTYGTSAYTTTYSDTAAKHWPAQAAVSGNSFREARELAEQELNRRAFPATTIAGSVTYTHAALRERDYANVLVPRVGRTHVCRVLARSLDDSSPLIGLELQVMPDGATTRVPPPGRGSKARGRGYGSISQRLLRASRQNG